MGTWEYLEMTIYPTKEEYAVEKKDPKPYKSLSDLLNRFSRIGWELVTIFPPAYSCYPETKHLDEASFIISQSLIAIFKRETAIRYAPDATEDK